MIACLIGFDNFQPEAGIINYYHLNSTLSGHQDHSEENLDAPLISISFGNPGVFLIGGKTKDVKPTAIAIKSGDVLVMSGESRLSLVQMSFCTFQKNLILFDYKFFIFEKVSWSSKNISRP